MITAGDLRKLVDGMPDDQEIPVSLAYGEETFDHIFVRLDEASTSRPTHPVGNIHDHIDKALFITITLVDCEDVDGPEE